MLELITEEIWQTITAEVRKNPHRCRIAVAYFSTGAAARLPLSKGSTLVIDMSESAVKSGQTKPSEVLKLLRKGVDVHTVENLHAKVFVVGRRAFVGSTNVSGRSANTLVEAALHTSHRETVADCRRFVMSLVGDRVTKNQAMQMQKLYRPPRIPGAKSRQATKAKVAKNGPRTWLVSLEPYQADGVDLAIGAKATERAAARIRSSKWFRVSEFYWQGSDRLSADLKRHDRVIQIFSAERTQRMFPPERVVKVTRYKKGRKANLHVCLEARKGLPSKRLGDVKKTLPEAKKLLKSLYGGRELRADRLIRGFLQLWPKAAG